MVSRVNDEYTITLTGDEVYTLQILLGFVACDKECLSINNKLEDVSGVEMMCEDYARATFAVESMDTGVAIRGVSDDETVTIRFN